MLPTCCTCSDPNITLKQKTKIKKKNVIGVVFFNSEE